MNLGHVERGTKFKIFEEYEGRAVSDEFEAVFKYLETEKLFIVQSPELYEYYGKLNSKAHLIITFMTGSYSHTFIGRAVEKQRSNGAVLIEQCNEISTINRRRHDRDELRVKVNVYGISQRKLNATHFDKPEAEPELSDMSYDISPGGVCVIANVPFISKYDPYFLLEFSLGKTEKDSFVLPARLVRRSNYPRTKVGRYDYGFEFIFDNLPDERGRVARAILSRKLAYL
ncbi:MAG: PilZ domain-containing protein [Oscillospiraceae bacterium]|nr:PilZ domain-containing protein [Oscillospiraceae bacterium]